MFWKKEPVLGNYVKYSRNTAQCNPDMIIKEYIRLSDLEKKERDNLIKNLRETCYIKVDLTPHLLNKHRICTSYSVHNDDERRHQHYSHDIEIEYENLASGYIKSGIDYNDSRHEFVVGKLSIHPKVLAETLSKVDELEKEIDAKEKRISEINTEMDSFISQFGTKKK